MLFTHTITALVLAYATTTHAAKAYIKNYCKENVYLWPVDALRNPQTPITIAPGGDYSETYQVLASGGVSLKLSRDPANKVKATQFEYTLVGGFIWYDGSHVDCQGAECPFYADGIYLEASDPTCPTRTCQPNAVCTGFYVLFNDDINTLSCQPNADINMYLCATNNKGPSSGGAPPAASASAIAAPSVPVVASAPAVQPSVTAPMVKMEAVHGVAPQPTTLRKVAARQEDHVHDHMRRHNHMRQH
jgi:hypothetical protein